MRPISVVASEKPRQLETPLYLGVPGKPWVQLSAFQEGETWQDLPDQPPMHGSKLSDLLRQFGGEEGTLREPWHGLDLPVSLAPYRDQDPDKTRIAITFGFTNAQPASTRQVELLQKYAMIGLVEAGSLKLTHQQATALLDECAALSIGVLRVDFFQLADGSVRELENADLTRYKDKPCGAYLSLKAARRLIAAAFRNHATHCTITLYDRKSTQDYIRARKADPEYLGHVARLGNSDEILAYLAPRDRPKVLAKLNQLAKATS